MSTSITAHALAITVRVPDGEVASVHAAPERPLEGIFDEVRGQLHLVVPANVIVLFAFAGAEYGLERRLGDIPNLKSGDELTVIYRTRSG